MSRADLVLETNLLVRVEAREQLVHARIVAARMRETLRLVQADRAHAPGRIETASAERCES